ncbi:glycoside hydrolase [Diplogelasinospora grovesii]|uniref:endo-1,3(4)-beta-glucanase n=1 Tax=Diplogelasinospora grovesii TaxID=303347 RepID=A0AAN6SA06_9PEZI|nr:glycoside hydrolase [Diplogelasinospora grovesii]
MVLSTTALAALAAAAVAGVARAADYALVDQYDKTNFFSEFDFFSGPDPTHGYVDYVDATTANNRQLAGYAGGKGKGGNDAVYLGVDHVNVTQPSGTGRSSVRVSSRKAYTRGLFVADIAHMPAGSAQSSSCGLWPAFWMFGPNWPSSGEIDILEGVNSQQSNAVTLHTSDGCTIQNTAGAVASTKLVSSNCYGSTGCGQQTDEAGTFGSAFNAQGGGIYAVEWTDSAISVWFFPRDSATTQQLSSGGGNATAPPPDTSTFGQPLAAFVGGSSCSIDSHFRDHALTFNTAFCGDWAGKVWSSDAKCAALAGTCEEYVAANPAAFADAYWLINSVKVYQQQQAGNGAATRRSRLDTQSAKFRL